MDENQLRFKSFRANIGVFISHSAEDVDAAISLRNDLRQKGFLNSWTYEKDLPFGQVISSKIKENILKSSFFILISTESARNSKYVSRELGLALKLSEENSGAQPIIFTFIPKESVDKEGDAENKDKNKFASFDYRDFETGQLIGKYTIKEKRAFVEGSKTDNIDELVRQMTPIIKRIGTDIRSEIELDEIRFFDLYNSMFPEEERVPKEQLIRTLFYRTRQEVNLLKRSVKSKLFSGENNNYVYHQETHSTALIIGGVAIGLSWCTFDYETKYLFGSWIAVQSCWRSYNIAGTYMKWLEKSVCEVFPRHKGLIFDVEPIDFNRAERLIVKLEKIADKENIMGDYKSIFVDKTDQEDINEIRKLKRIMLYERKGALLFTNSRARPLDYFQPCLNVEKSVSQWRDDKCLLWLMFYPLGATGGVARPKQMWRDAVNLIAVEIIGKTYAMDRPDVGEHYLRHAKRRRDEALRRSRMKRISLERIIKSNDISDLLTRWEKFNIKLPL